MEKQKGNVYFLIDTSGSNDGSRIDYLNSTFKSLIPAIKELSSGIKIAIITYSNGASLFGGTKPVPAAKYNFRGFDAAGVTDFGAALRILNELLTNNNKPNNLFIMITDGEPTDNWEPELAKLKQNNNFNDANKIVITIGDDVDDTYKHLNDFTGNKKAILNNFDKNILLGFIEKSLKKLTKQEWFDVISEMEDKIYDWGFVGYIEKDEPVRYPASSSPNEAW